MLNKMLRAGKHLSTINNTRMLKAFPASGMQSMRLFSDVAVN